MKRLSLTACYVATCLIVLVGLGFLWIGPPPRSASREVPPAARCQRKLEDLGEAIVRCRAERGEVPQFVEEQPGLRHSWRVLLIQYMYKFDEQDRQELAYRFGEPWNSAHNLWQLRSWDTSYRYVCPLDYTRFDQPFVSYLMLVRPNQDMRLLPDDAVLIVETTGCGIQCSEPRDIEIESLFRDGSAFGVGKLNSLHPKFVRAIRVDGKVIDIPKDIAQDDLRDLLMGSR